VRRAEMFLHFFHGGELEGLRHIQADVFCLEAQVLDPFLDHRLVLDDLHPRLEQVERHPRKFLRVQLAQLVLVIVIIRRAEDDPAHAALRHEGINTLRRFGGRAFGLIERAKMVL
jgi:hypothetical protein